MSDALAARLAVLAAWAPTLESAQLTFGRWEPSWTDGNGVMHLGWYEFSPEADRFRREMASAGWVQPVDWMAWARSPAGRTMIEDPVRVASATADELVLLVTAAIRGDRFSEGSLAGAYESGMLLAIARRAQALLATRPNEIRGDERA